MKANTPTKASTPTKRLASSDSSPNVVKCSASTNNKKKAVEKVLKKDKKKVAEEVIKKDKKQQQNIETSNAASDNSNNKKKMKKKKDDNEEMLMCTFPMARVCRLIKSGEFGTDNIRTSQDAVFLVNKASEMFLNRFIEDAFTQASSPNTKRSKNSPFLTYQHLSSAVSTGKPYEFLSDYVPEKVKAEDALKLWASIKSQ